MRNRKSAKIKKMEERTTNIMKIESEIVDDITQSHRVTLRDKTEVENPMQAFF